MNVTADQQKVLAALIEQGIDKSTERLAQMTKTRWEMSTMSLTTASGDRIQTLVAPAAGTHYGVCFTAPGATFVAMFPGESARRVVQAFTKGGGERLKAVADLEKNAIAEISNILVNAVAGVIADTLDRALIVSAPEILEGAKNKLMETALRRSDNKNSFALMSYVSMSSSDLSTDCLLVILLNSELLENLLTAIEI
ncbi:MAG: hypothetical protein HY551_05245 [Elusimicrobia bacterium]|nr:hypothetical protein [Elusimicrobiota bacterium]